MDEPENRLPRIGITVLAAFFAIVAFALVYGPVTWALLAIGASDAIASIFGLVAGFFAGRATFRWLHSPANRFLQGTPGR